MANAPFASRADAFCCTGDDESFSVTVPEKVVSMETTPETEAVDSVAGWSDEPQPASASARAAAPDATAKAALGIRRVLWIVSFNALSLCEFGGDRPGETTPGDEPAAALSFMEAGGSATAGTMSARSFAGRNAALISSYEIWPRRGDDRPCRPSSGHRTSVCDPKKASAHPRWLGDVCTRG